MKKIICLILTLFAGLSLFSQISLDNDVYKKVSANVFEVVVEKHEDTSIVYEKELPLERIPFAIRNDKYIPLGTAFLLTDGSFYTAAHVLSLYNVSVYDKYFIRDTAENVYEIDLIQEFSQRRDFVKFTAKDFKFQQGMGLETSDKFEINSNVFSVGNALGEGIVIRNGSLTSQTYEEKNGDWKWIRFSAAASPGNSGGPLINPDGTVIGIITMKSENENLNYALPIKEVNAEKANTGLAYADYKYVLPNILSYHHPHIFKAEVELPKTLSEVNKTVTALHQKDIESSIDLMKKDYSPNGEKCFDNSSQQDDFFANVYGSPFPLLLYLNQNGSWDYAQPNNLKTFNLEDNGYVEYGSMLNYYFARIHKPDSLELKELVENPKVTMDYLIKAFAFKRNVYGEQVSILSFGEPVKSEEYKDYFGRTWYLNYFSLDFSDAMAMTFLLPTPSGAIVLCALSTRNQILRTINLDTEFMADFIYPRYGGKIKYWRDYFGLPEKMRNKFSPLEKELSMKESDDGIVFSTDSIKLAISKKDIQYNDDSAIVVRTGYTKKDGKLASEIRNISFWTSTKEEDYKSVSVLLIRNPGKNSKEDLQQWWKQYVNQVLPYNGEPYNEEKCTYLDKILYQEGYDKSNAEDSEYLYIFSYEIEGQNKFDEIKDFASKIETGITVK